MSPTQLGYRFPAEWEPHAATWISWPHRLKTWPGKFEPIPGIYTHLVKTLAAFEPVNILAGAGPVADQAQQLVGDVPRVTIYDIPTNDTWARDHGPMFLVGPPGEQPALIEWRYNAWGGKYPPYDFDDAVPEQIAKRLGRKRFTPEMILEGGSVDGNGHGTLLTSEQCLLNPNRNPNLSRGEIEQFLADYCGAKKVLWLGSGIEGDDTDGHVDELARFVNPTTVVCALEHNSADVNYDSLQENYRRLLTMSDQDGRPLEIIPLPMPQPIYYDNQRLPASYCNFYIANGVVLVPQFDDPADGEVTHLFTRLFPGRKVIGMPARDLVWGRGAYHCITQQQPA